MADSKVEIQLELLSKLDGINQAITGITKTRKKTNLLNRELFRMDDLLIKGGVNLVRFGSASAIAGVGIAGAFGVKAVKTFASFEKSMKGVEAILKPTTKELKELEEEARRLGRTTKFTAREAAAGIEILAKNGIKTTDILGGMLEASLLLSASVGTDLPSAADVMTDALKIFELKAEDAIEVVNSINAVTVNSKFTFEDYADALAKGGASAVGAGQDIDQFNNTITATASFFSSGQEAGTAYKVFLDRLSGSTRLTEEATNAAQRAQRKLGLEFFDTQGNLRDMSLIAEDLSEALENLTPEERIKAFKDLFGTRGKNFAIALGRAGKEGIKTAESLAKLVDAAKQAETRLEGTEGSITKLKSAYESVLITFGQPIANKITPLIETLTGEIALFAEDQERVNALIDDFFDSVIQGGATALDVLTGVEKIFTGIGIGLNGIKLFSLQQAQGVQQKSVNRAEQGVQQASQREGITRDEFTQKFPDSQEVIRLTNAYQQLIKVNAQLQGAEVANGALFDRLNELGDAERGQDLLNFWENYKIKVEETKALTDELRDANASMNQTALQMEQSLNNLSGKKGADLEEEKAKLQALRELSQEQIQYAESLGKLKDLKKNVRNVDKETTEQQKQTLAERIADTEKEVEATRKAVEDKKNYLVAFIPAVKDTADTAEKEFPKISGALEDTVVKGKSSLEELNQALVKTQQTIKQTTKVGEQFENDAVRNSWLKDTALKGVEFLSGLVKDGFDPLSERLGTISKVGAVASSLAVGAMAGTDQQGVNSSSSSSVGVGQASVGGLAQGLFDPRFTQGAVATVDEDIAIINEESALKREEILRNETLTQTEKNAKILELENQKNQSLQSLDDQVNADRARNFETSLSTISTLMQSHNKTLFRIGKAAAIAQATIDGIRGVQTALASAPPPFNFVLAGLVGAASAVNIAKIASQRPPSFIEGGLIGGRLEPNRRADNITANVATGEFVTNPQATARNLPFLEFVNRGGDVASLFSQSVSRETATPVSTGLSQGALAPAPNTGGGETNLNILNSLDPGEIFDRMEQEGFLDDFLENRMSDSKFSTRFGTG